MYMAFTRIPCTFTATFIAQSAPELPSKSATSFTPGIVPLLQFAALFHTPVPAPLVQVMVAGNAVATRKAQVAVKADRMMCMVG